MTAYTYTFNLQNGDQVDPDFYDAQFTAIAADLAAKQAQINSSAVITGASSAQATWTLPPLGLANRVLGWDSSGNPTTQLLTDFTAQAIAAAASASAASASASAASDSASSAAASAATAIASIFPSGTRMPFNQSAAPTGWTKDVTAALNDSIMRIVTGAAGSGGATAFSAFNGQAATDTHALTIVEIPGHTHATWRQAGAGFASGGLGTPAESPATGVTGSTGGGAGGAADGHAHGITTAIKYYDFIIAVKN